MVGAAGSVLRTASGHSKIASRVVRHGAATAAGWPGGCLGSTPGTVQSKAHLERRSATEFLERPRGQGTNGDGKHPRPKHRATTANRFRGFRCSIVLGGWMDVTNEPIDPQLRRRASSRRFVLAVQ